MDVVIGLAQRLHTEGVIQRKLGKSIPIIIHELEYYDQPVSCTKSGNPKGVTEEFEE
jgi:hypothetical protein